MFGRMRLAVLTVAIAIAALFSEPAAAQFRGPSVSGSELTVVAAQSARVGSYVVLTGSVVSHLRDDYFLFRDASGDIRVEIANRVWGGREVTPEDTVRVVGEVDRNRSGVTYLWIKSLDVVN